MKKNHYTLLLLLLLPVCGLFAQDSSYTISGHFEKINNQVIYLMIYKPKQTILDSTKIVDGRFSFQGTITSPSYATLRIPTRKNDGLAFYVEPSNIEIVVNQDSLKLATIKGSAINDDDRLLKERMKQVNQWEDADNKIYEAAHQAGNKEVMDSLDDVDFKILDEKRKIVGAFVREFPHSVRGAMAILENFAYYAEASDVTPLYDQLAPEVRNSVKGREIKKMIDVYSTVAIGKTAPEIEERTPLGKKLSLHSLRGKYVLVDFWASWCGPCRRENPQIVAAFNQFKNDGFTIYGVSYDINKAKWEKAIKDDHLDWHQVSDLKGWQNATSDLYGIKAIPSNLLLDREGKIIGKNLFGKKLMNKLAQVLPQN